MYKMAENPPGLYSPLNLSTTEKKTKKQKNKKKKKTKKKQKKTRQIKRHGPIICLSYHDLVGSRRIHDQISDKSSLSPDYRVSFE